MKALTAQEIQELDRVAIEEEGIPSLTLMETAGRSIAQEIVNERSSFCIVCGSGNNGGDGFVVARHLIEAKKDVVCFLIGDKSKLKPDALANYELLNYVHSIDSVNEEFTKAISDVDCVVDAIFGVGLAREIKEPSHSIITVINQSGKHIVAIDVPSGLDATTGDVLGVSVKAHQTFTFTAEKRGFRQNQGLQQCGDIKVIDIGIPKELIQKIHDR